MLKILQKYIQNNPTLTFWGITLFLNLLLFAPSYLLNTNVSTFLPQNALPEGKWAGMFSAFFMRNNYDIFRLHVDFLIWLGLLAILYRVFSKQKIWFILTFMVYWCFLAYAIYYSGSIKMFGDHPYFLNDYVLAREVLPLFFGGMSSDINILYWLGGLVGVGMIILTYQLIKILIQSLINITNYRTTTLIFSGLCAFVVLDSVRKNYEKTSYPYEFNTVRWEYSLIAKSANLKETKAVVDPTIIETYQNFSNQKQDSLPNIYLIFIESYGATLYTSPELKEPYLKVLNSIEDSLLAYNWSSTSILSESPIVGGRSWLSFTSVLTGLSIGNHLQYNDLLKNHVEFPHLMRYLSSQGYQTYRMNTMIDKKITDSTFITDLNAFYDFDHWIQFRDIQYKGLQHEPMFGGLPDQYAINYLQDSVYKNQSHPLFLFFITMTSHVPFYEPPPLVKDWTTLNIIDTTYKINYDLDGSPPNRYIKSMQYELLTFTQFLTHEIDDNSIVILLGDHQPPWIANEGPEVPLHIIAKDKNLLKRFQSYGFQEGMQIQDFKQKIHHKDIYKVLVAVLQ